MRKVCKELEYLHKVERLCEDLSTANSANERQIAMLLLSKHSPWLLDTLLKFMNVAASLALNQKENDFAVLNSMALDAARDQAVKGPTDV